MIHVNELTQPQGHSTSGSHERYKDADRLAWEREFDCIRQMKLWMIAINIASSEELDEIDANAKKEVLEGSSGVLLILLLKNKRTSFLIGKNS
jgi:TPP-dependent pyruvate/acetoin dehydrogenase alpha subunit